MLSFLKKFPGFNCRRSSKPAESEKHVRPLQKMLTSGDFSLSQFATLFEGRFIKLDENLQLPDQSGDIAVTTIALAVILAGLPIPAMLFAEDDSAEKQLKMIRLYPLWKIKLSMDKATCILTVETSKGVSNYKLLVPMEADADYLSRWLKIISLVDDS